MTSSPPLIRPLNSRKAPFIEFNVRSCFSVTSKPSGRSASAIAFASERAFLSGATFL